MSINNPEQRQNTTNPDIADSTHDLKALHAQPAVIPPREHRDERLGWKKPAAIVALLGAGAAAAFGITKAAGGHESANPVPERSPSTSAPATPGQSESAAPEKGTDANADVNPQFGLSANKYTNDPEQAVTDFVSQLNAWENAGFADNMDKDPRRFELGDDAAFAGELTTKSNEEFAANIFIGGWETNDDLKKFFDDLSHIHQANIETAMKTTPGGNRANIEHYKRYIDVVPESVKADVNADGLIVASFDYTGRDNADKNQADELYHYGGGVDPNQESGHFDVTFVKDGDALRVADIVVHTNH